MKKKILSIVIAIALGLTLFATPTSAAGGYGTKNGCTMSWSHGQQWSDGRAFASNLEMSSCVRDAKTRVYYRYAGANGTRYLSAVNSTHAIAVAPSNSIAAYSRHWNKCYGWGSCSTGWWLW